MVITEEDGISREKMSTSKNKDVSDILSSLNDNYIQEFKPFIDRYFPKTGFADVKEDHKEDTCIRIHNNGLCLISISDNHPVIKEKKNVKNINFKINESLDRTKNEFSGKYKKGAQVVKPVSVLCYIECHDGTTYPVYAGIKGRLLEVNDKLIKNPELLIEDNNSNGYICIIRPDKSE